MLKFESFSFRLAVIQYSTIINLLFISLLTYLTKYYKETHLFHQFNVK